MVIFEMSERVWIKILIAVITAALTCVVNWRTLVFEIKKAKRDKVNERKVPLYIECYELLERNIADNNVIFQREYIDDLVKIKSKMKLIASNSVLQAFKAYYKWAVDIYKSYLDFCIQKDPARKVHLETTLDGEEFEVADFDEHDLEYYEFLQNKYITDRSIESITVKSKTQDVLNAMRSELGNDTFKDDLFS